MYKKIFITALLVFFVDQITKLFLKDKEFLFITPVQNTGIAFGLFQGYNWLFILIIVLILAAIFYYLKSIPKKLHLAFGFLIGGAFGNLVDRIFFGYVIDFIDLKFWPIFNVADFSNTIAIFILIYYLWKNG